MAGHAATVHSYYRLVDDQQFEQMLQLFHPEIHYQRGDLAITGIDQMKEFYTRERTIKSGRHTIDALVEDGAMVVTRGTMDGVLDGGEEVSIGFADFLEFQDDLIWRRFTYFKNRSV